MIFILIFIIVTRIANLSLKLSMLAPSVLRIVQAKVDSPGLR
jgi:hypothetical protein